MNESRNIAVALADLVDSAALVDYSSAPRAAREATLLALTDSLGVAFAGAATPEHRALRASWPLPVGDTVIWGTGASSDPQTACLFNGVSLCTLELDEGNKLARGHPGAHVIPAAFAEAQRVKASGMQLLDAILSGYEIAARVARAFAPRTGLHPHGHWGALGAAFASGRLQGFTTPQLIECIDVAAGLVLATPFSSALEGSYVRNFWIGAASSNGITAARIVAAGLGSESGNAASSLGSILGTIDPALLRRTPNEPLAITEGYFKHHAACAYTHPPADAAIQLRAEHPTLDVSSIESIHVDTHGLAAPLNNMQPRNRLAAMFSIPHVVVVALTAGECRPESFASDAIAAPEIERLRSKVTVTTDAVMDARLPLERRARVTVQLSDGSALSTEVINARGDSSHHPFSAEDIAAKATRLIGDPAAKRVMSFVAGLPTFSDFSTAVGALHWGDNSQPNSS